MAPKIFFKLLIGRKLLYFAYEMRSSSLIVHRPIEVTMHVRRQYILIEKTSQRNTRARLVGGYLFTFWQLVDH